MTDYYCYFSSFFFQYAGSGSTTLPRSEGGYKGSLLIFNFNLNCKAL